MENQPEPSHPDHLVVDELHLELVRTRLERLGVTFDEPEANVDLGLVRLTGLGGAFDGKLELDELITLLRQHFAAEWDGWVPLLGKDRLVDGVIAAGHKPMAFELPVPAQPGELAPPAESGGAGVRIGVVDVPGGPPDGDGVQPMDAGHADFVKYLITSRAPDAMTELVKVPGDGPGPTRLWDTAVQMLKVAVGQRVHVLNLSIGCYAPGGPPLLISRAIERLTARGVLVIAAAGNHGAVDGLFGRRTRESALWPAALLPVIAVGAHDPGAEPPEPVVAPFTPDRTWVTCTGPGVGVVGPYLDGPVDLDGTPTPFAGYARWSGTSFATATVTGAIAARMSADQVDAREALRRLLDDNDVVRSFGRTPPPALRLPLAPSPSLSHDGVRAG